jgi:hypothetical protein
MRMRTLSAVAAAAILAAVLSLALLPGPAAGQMMEGKTGDLNMDGVANSLDALLVLFYDARLSAPAMEDEGWWVAAADVDCDLAVTARDATLILRADAGLYEIRA